MGREAKAAAVTSSAKNIPHECQDLAGLCVCVRACALVFGARIYINVNLSLCISSRRPFRYKLPVLPSSQSPISTGKSVSPTFLRSLSRCFKDHCPLLLSF